MTVKKRGLGRGLNDLGLDQLLSEFDQPEAKKGHHLSMMAVDALQPGQYQPRRDMNFEALQELADSIADQGVIQPILVRSIASNQYEILAGERRWRAAKMAGLMEIPVLIRQVEDQTAMIMGLIENIQRENLNAMEEANALARLLNEFGLTHEQVAKSVGRSRSAVSNILRLLALPQELKIMVEHGDIEMGHARALLPLEKALQIQLANEVVAQGLSVRATEHRVQQVQKKSLADEPEQTVYSAGPDPDVLKLQEKLCEQMNTTVKIKHNKKGKGSIVLHYKDMAELDRLLLHLHPEVG